MEQERQEGQLDDGETLGDFGAAIPLVITRGHRRGLGYITRDPPGFMLVFLFKGPTSVTMRDEESGVRCTYVCRECQLLRSSDRTLPMAPFVFVVSGRFITNPESSPFWEHYCKLRPTGEVFAEGALNELRRATTMDTSDASRREAVARCIASTEARTDISDIEKADMWRRMLTSLRAKKGYRSACALLRAALSKNPAVSYLRSSAEERIEAQFNNVMSDPTGPERLKSEEDGGVPFRIGFVKQEVFDNEFDGTSSKGEGQAKASSSATPENGDLAASRNPGGPQESSARVDLAVMKTEPQECEGLDKLARNACILPSNNAMETIANALGLASAPVEVDNRSEQEKMISLLHTLAPPLRRSHVILSALERLGVSWHELLTEAEAILTSLSDQARSLKIAQIHEVATSVAEFIGSSSLAPSRRADDFGVADLIGDYGLGVNIPCKQFKRALLGYRTKHPAGYMVVYMMQAPSNSWLNVAATSGSRYHMEETQPISRQADVDDGFIHPFQCFDCSQIYSRNWQMKKIPRVRVIKRRFVSDPEKPLNGSHTCKFRKVGEVLAEWKMRELCYALKSKNAAKERITRELHRITKRNDLSAEEKLDMHRSLLKPTFTFKPRFIIRPRWAKLYREAAAELESNPGLKNLLSEGSGSTKEDSKQGISSNGSCTSYDARLNENEGEASGMSNALPLLQDIRESLMCGDHSPLSETMHRSHMVVRILQKVGVERKHLIERIDAMLSSLHPTSHDGKVAQIMQLINCSDFS